MLKATLLRTPPLWEGHEGDLLGYSVIASGFSMTAKETYYSHAVITEAGLTIAITGFSLFLDIRVFKLFRPFTYATNYNLISDRT